MTDQTDKDVERGARDRIAEMLLAYRLEQNGLTATETADAIIAALPSLGYVHRDEIRVKPLVWENFDAWTWWAHTDCNTYRVNERSGQWTARRALRVNGEGFLPQLANTEESAKAAANDHYRAQIMAALGVTL